MLRNLEKRDRRRLRGIEGGGGQWTTVHRPGIEVQPIGAQIGHSIQQRCVPVNDQAGVIALIRKERLPDPDQVMVVLRIERPVRIDAGVDEEAPAVIIAEWQRTQPVDVWRGRSAGLATP